LIICSILFFIAKWLKIFGAGLSGLVNRLLKNLKNKGV